ncbi:hypothetical protein B2G71_06245 [Novosphingobium sp. PC22D]|nr:hypothetical protein B2G71_06245 [Novosphingobium sp. PC22D]
MSFQSAYLARRRDALFAQGWAAALVLAREHAAQVLATRAFEGVEEEIWYRGELVGTRRRFDARLLPAHLARLDRLADETCAGELAARFDDVVAQVAGVTLDEGMLDPRAPEGSAERVVPMARDDYAFEAAERVDREVRKDYYRAAAEAEALDPEARVEAIARAEDERVAAFRQARDAALVDWDEWRARALAAVDAAAARWPGDAATKSTTSPGGPPGREGGARSGDDPAHRSRAASFDAGCERDSGPCLAIPLAWRGAPADFGRSVGSSEGHASLCSGPG